MRPRSAHLLVVAHKLEAYSTLGARPVPAELVQPRRLPDGLLQAQLSGQTRHDLFLLEVSTYPERRVTEQLSRLSRLRRTEFRIGVRRLSIVQRLTHRQF
jgi:hypothetical protein